MNYLKPYLVIPKLIEQPTWGGSYIVEMWPRELDAVHTDPDRVTAAVPEGGNSGPGTVDRHFWIERSEACRTGAGRRDSQCVEVVICPCANHRHAGVRSESEAKP